MTQEDVKKKMQEGAAKLTPIVTEVSSLMPMPIKKALRLVGSY